MKDSTWLASDSIPFQRKEFYKEEVVLPDRTVAMGQRGYVMGNDDYVVVGMVLMFLLLAVVVYKSRVALLYRLKSFFTEKRVYIEENVKGNSLEVFHVFLLLTVSACSLSIIFFDDLMEWNSFVSVTGVPYWFFAVGFVVCLCFIYLKAGIYSIVNWTFFDSDSSKRWMTGYFLITSLTAFFFYLIAVLDVFSNLAHEIVIGGAILVVVLYEMLLFYKLIVNFRVRKYGYMFIFLYFCSAELLPTLVFGHLAVWITDSFIVKNYLY